MENKNTYNRKFNNKRTKKKKPASRIIKVSEKMTRKTTSLVFFDLEMNCSFHKEENHGIGETISIGVVKYNLKNKNISEFYSVIKPTFNNIMSTKIIELTNLLQEEVNSAKSFKEVFIEFEKWIEEEDCIFISWGPDDIRVLLGDNTRNEYNLEIINTIHNNFIDFQGEYGLHRESKQAISLKNALSFYDIEFQGNQHNALDDAYNLFTVYQKYSDELLNNICTEEVGS